MTTEQSNTLNQVEALDTSNEMIKRMIKYINQQLEKKYDIQANPDDYFNPESDLTVAKSLIRHTTEKLKKEINYMQVTLSWIEKELNEI